MFYSSQYFKRWRYASVIFFIREFKQIARVDVKPFFFYITTVN
jgi:hypothetical protein